MGDLEIWKAVVGYEGLYEVSNLGRVRSLKGHNNFDRVKILAQHHSNVKVPYKTVTLYNRNKGRTTYNVHRLVATAFIPNPDNLECVNHKDENTFNNNSTNLEWCTKGYNVTYGTATKRAAQKRWKKVIFLNGTEIVHQFESVLAAGEFFGVRPQSIARAARGVRGSFHGFTVKYV